MSDMNNKKYTASLATNSQARSACVVTNEFGIAFRLAQALGQHYVKYNGRNGKYFVYVENATIADIGEACVTQLTCSAIVFKRFLRTDLDCKNLHNMSENDIASLETVDCYFNDEQFS